MAASPCRVPCASFSTTRCGHAATYHASQVPPALRCSPRLIGIIDCTECRTQTPTEKLAQRALWSDYKSHNTVKYLVVLSPSGATIYVSPAFPGRISDPQICFACATYNEEDPSAIADIIENMADTADEFEE